MQSLVKRLLVTGTTVVGVVGLASGPTFAQSANQMYQTNLTALNGSGTTGTAMVEKIDDNSVKVTVKTNGASPGVAHAQHIHFGGKNICPEPSAASGKDPKNITDTVEGQSAYGEAKISLTTKGGVGTESILAVDRFPVANGAGVITYERTFDLPKGVSMNDLEKGVVVQHGIAKLYGDKAKYDGDAKSPLKESLPLEATVPAACGALTSAPKGGVAAGGGSTAGVENVAFAAIGASALVAAGAVAVSRRFTNATS